MQLRGASRIPGIDPDMTAGPPGYGLELWLATAWMSVTFPLIVVFCDALGFWPLVGSARRDAPAGSAFDRASDRLVVTA